MYIKNYLTMKITFKIGLVAVLLMMVSTNIHALSLGKFWKIVSPDKKTEVTVGTVNYIWV